jgi:hypothetical protein
MPKSSKQLLLLKQKFNEIKAMAQHEDEMLAASMRQSASSIRNQQPVAILIESGS